MKYVVDQNEMKAIDTYSIEKIGIPSLVLMERAAAAVAQKVEERMMPGDKVLAVAGSGNNGADAVAAARILYNRGYDAAVCFAADEKNFTPELKKQKEIIRNLGIREYNNTEPDFKQYTWLIDGLFGIGLSRDVEGRMAQIIQKMNSSGSKICAVDIPSGIHAGSGQVMGTCIHAEMTVTFGQNKLGLVLYPGCEHSGEVFVCDIGFARNAAVLAEPKVRAMEISDIKKYMPARSAYSNKGSYGKLLVIAGSKGMSGACILSAGAAYRTGVGLVRVLTCEENRTIIQQALPEAIVSCYDAENPQISEIKACIQWADTIVAGPGIGTGKASQMILNTVLSESSVPVIMDADALNILAAAFKAKEGVDGLIAFLGRQCPVIVTPHLGEMARLTGRDIAGISRNLFETCRKFAKRYQVICVLKDARTVISDSMGTDYVNLSGNNGMATGGSGDVLSGMIGGLVCQHKDKGQENLKRMAALGVYIHGLSGDEAKKRKGVYGLLASDIIKYIAYVIQ